MNEALLKRVLESPRLPSLPAIALEVIQLVQQKDVNIKQIADTIKHDPALATKILKTVNSSFYGQACSIATVSHALVVLGLNSVRTLALGFSLVSNLKDDRGDDAFDHLDFWKRSLFTATATKALARKAGIVQHEEAFLCGLLQDMGMLAMFQTLKGDYTSMVGRTGGLHRRLTAMEREALDLTHSQVGAALAQSWGLPPLLVGAINHHHDPDGAGQAIRPIVRCVSLGNHIADIFMLPDEHMQETVELYVDRLDQWMDITEAESEPLLRDIHKQTQEMRRLFDLPTGGLGNPDVILSKANEALLNLTMQAQQQSSQLEQQNLRLSSEAHTDSLTGVANRRAFDGFVVQEFDQATPERPLSVMFLDVDHFKQFNDRHGHACGDQVLAMIAQTLERTVADRGRVFRYGGEEFVIVCPAMGRKAAAQLAEHTRRAVESLETVSGKGGRPLGITACIGVACHEGQTFSAAAVLVKAADQGVYAAKEAGRNCVRVFTPRRRAA